jgi:hypothetical protein
VKVRNHISQPNKITAKKSFIVVFGISESKRDGNCVAFKVLTAVKISMVFRSATP